MAWPPGEPPAPLTDAEAKAMAAANGGKARLWTFNEHVGVVTLGETDGRSHSSDGPMGTFPARDVGGPWFAERAMAALALVHATYREHAARLLLVNERVEAMLAGRLPPEAPEGTSRDPSGPPAP